MKRHHVYGTANHEDALFFDENGLSRKALMWGSIENYFIWQTDVRQDPSNLGVEYEDNPLFTPPLGTNPNGY